MSPDLDLRKIKTSHSLLGSVRRSKTYLIHNPLCSPHNLLTCPYPTCYQAEAAKKEDLYHNLGRLLCRQGTAVPISAARWQNMAREYCVKVFFLPLMASFYSNSLQTFERLVSFFCTCAW